MSHKLRYRQVHLDFHTSPHISNIGLKFDKKQWQQRLKAGHVNSITIFAVGHHGLAYYDTKLGNKHPNLKFDLLRAQFDACKEINVNAPIYITAGINNWASELHPEWREINCDGKYAGWSTSPIQPGFHKMCFNTPFLDLLCKQIREVVHLYPNCDGIFLDIISQGPCCCNWCLNSMKETGLDACNEEDRKLNARTVLEKYYRLTTEAVKTDNPDMPIFHNSGHITKGNTKILKYFSHLELESLPTGSWGYDHFPLSAKYVLQLEHDFMGMTGKFHTTWGEFGGFKHPNALRYECAAMIAMGAKCSVGDQLHPCGELDESTYNIIGAAYKEVEEKETWCDNVISISDFGLLSSADVNSSHERENASDTGAGRVMLEGQLLFDVIDGEMDFTKYKALLLPDEIKVNSDLKKKIDNYLTQGGKLILAGDGGLNEDNSDFLWETGATFFGASEFQPDYMLPSSDVKPDFCSSPIVMYLRSNRIKVGCAQSLGKVYDPYFNRTFEHFCSHQHTPYKMVDSGYDCAIINNNILYFAHPVFSIYRWYGAVTYKDYILNSIRKLIGKDISLTTNMPSVAQLSLMEQRGKHRYILHLLYANKILRGGTVKMSGGNIRNSSSIEVIEELTPLTNTEIKITTAKPIKKITLEPQGKEISYKTNNNQTIFTVDTFECHQMVVLEY